MDTMDIQEGEFEPSNRLNWQRLESFTDEDDEASEHESATSDSESTVEEEQSENDIIMEELQSMKEHVVYISKTVEKMHNNIMFLRTVYDDDFDPDDSSEDEYEPPAKRYKGLM